ncbi:MAG: iron-sulfur cluster co-chaperone HscB C-terminal domain-containing protein [Chitinophagaceae bacterium]
MQYFELFEIPVQLKPDKILVRKKYLLLSKQYHPDYFANNQDADQQKVLEEAAILNKAFKTFNNPDETIRYVLKEKNLMEDDEKYQLPAEFLMQMMEINEELSEAVFAEDNNIKQKLQEQLTELEKSIYEPVAAIIENYQEGITTEEELLQVKDYYFKKKYLYRLREQLR